jgi:hypothetical protein
MEATNNVVMLDSRCDPRIDALTTAIEAVINERAVGKLPVVTVVGALELVKAQMLARLIADIEG